MAGDFLRTFGERKRITYVLLYFALCVMCRRVLGKSLARERDREIHGGHEEAVLEVGEMLGGEHLR